MFLNLFIAIIIDAFFGNTSLANMPVKEKSVTDFTRLWANYDKEATGFITVVDLESLITDLASAHEDEGAALIPFKGRVLDNKAFRNRQIMALEIPTYENMKKVMFYDVLMKLAHQSTTVYHMKDHFRSVRNQLKILKNLGVQNGPAFDDTLEAITNKNIKHQQHEVDLNKLLGMMSDRTTKIELVTEIMEMNKKMTAKYNHLVDTNATVIGADKAEKMIEQGNCPIELYTTLHLGSSRLIFNLISEYLSKGASANLAAP